MFLLSRGDLEGRFDVSYNLLLNRRLDFKFPCKTLKSFVSTFSGGTPSKSNAEFWQGDIPWVSPKDFRGFYLSDSEDHISPKAIEKSSTKLAPKHSVLVVVRSGVLIHTFPVCVNLVPVSINQDVKVLIPDSSVTSEYLGYFFKVFNKYVLDLTVKHSTTVQSINTYEFERLNIPVPPLEIQEKIVDSLDTVYAAKHEKEAEAKRLLESVDAYVLERLGIRLPAATDNALATRTFYRNSGEVLGGRFDAPSHSSKLSLESDSFPMVRFRDHVDINPRMSLAHLSDETPLSFVPMESISDLYGEITGTQTRVAGEAKGYTLFREGDILWAKITPCMQNGKSAIAENLLNGFGYGSTEYHVFRASNGELNQSYIFALLRLKYLRNEGVKFFSGSAGH